MMLLEAYRSFVAGSATIVASTLGPIGVHMPGPAIARPVVQNARIQALSAARGRPAHRRMREVFKLEERVRRNR